MAGAALSLVIANCARDNESALVRTAVLRTEDAGRVWIGRDRQCPSVKDLEAGRWRVVRSTHASRPKRALSKNSTLSMPNAKPVKPISKARSTVSYTHLRAHETRHDLVCRLLLEK